MCKYFEAAELEPEIRRLLIQEYGSFDKAKKDMDVFSGHLPENIRVQLNDFVLKKYPQISDNTEDIDIYKKEITKVVGKTISSFF